MIITNNKLCYAVLRQMHQHANKLKQKPLSLLSSTTVQCVYITLWILYLQNNMPIFSIITLKQNPENCGQISLKRPEVERSGSFPVEGRELSTSFPGLLTLGTRFRGYYRDGGTYYRKELLLPKRVGFIFYKELPASKMFVRIMKTLNLGM